MKRVIAVLMLLAALALVSFAQVQDPTRQDRFRINLVEPDGFLGLRLGNSFRFAEELLGEPDVVRNGSLEWRFRSPDYEPYEALTVLGDKRTIDGFVAHLKSNRIQFTDMGMRPEPNRLGTYHATKRYKVGKYDIAVTGVGDDSTYLRRIVLQTKREK